MILVDTSIWIDHLHRPEPDLVALLNDERVATHPMIIGELALGSIRSRSEVIGLLTDLPAVVVATHSECLQLVETLSLHGRGLSLVDAHLLAAVRLTSESTIWTRDRTLAAVAAEVSLAWSASS